MTDNMNFTDKKYIEVKVMKMLKIIMKVNVI